MPEQGVRSVAEPSSRQDPGALSALLAELARAPEGAWEAELRPGAVIGRFELIRELGRGGFGIVWEARDRELGRGVAFKALRRGAGRDVAEDPLLREAAIAASLSHPNVVTLFDFGRAPAGPFLVLELLRGETLGARLARGPLPPREAMRVALEIARGVAHAHASGVVHRDLKPGNVFLCSDGRVKVLDLGMAQAFAHRAMPGGTPGHMAPEQVRGAPEDERTDVFALGVLLFQMLRGELPPRDGAGDVEGAVLRVPELPSVAPLVARMLSADPVERPRDGGEVVAALAALEPGPAAPPKPSSASWRDTRYEPHGRGSGPPSIAVLPFANMSPEPGQEFFSDGVAEEILHALTRVRGLHVAGRTSSFSFRGSREDAATIGRKLGVTNVLEGSVRRAGDRARITAKLLSVSDGFTLWSQTYDRELTDVFAVQEGIASAVVAALEVRFARGEAPSVESHRTARPEVYDAYLIARRLLERRDLLGQAGATTAYEKVIALDPGYAPAWGDLAEALLWASDLVADTASRTERRRRALEAAERAVALDPGLATAWSTRGTLRMLLRWDFAAGREDLERAVALGRGDARVVRDHACMVLVPIGRVEEGLASLVRATELDPLDALAWTYLAMTYAGTGDVERCAQAAERALELDPGNPYAAFWRSAALVLSGRAIQATAVFAPHTSQAHEGFGLTIAAIAHHALGHASRSRVALEALEARFASSMPYQLAEIHAWRGEHERAFAWLERARTSQDAGLVLVTRDPFLRSLRSDPRYPALLRRLNLPPA
ncbi:protein kinase [Anaeromyxobacter sp. SG17]|uniref:protein kinase domain-containing protein n=1 Tax=Anaeromyxobacter sp. SG17 TaxID=2925405 RepID=UPI001F59151B|nr:protein kinase [Anaeromyxobacter sp. SG17]